MKKLALITILCFSTVTLFAGNKAKSGTAGAQQLLMPVGAKMIALSGAGVSSVSGIEALAWNPAGVSGMSGNSEITIFKGNGIADVGLNYFAGGFNFGDIGVFSFAIKSLDFGEIMRTDELNTDGTGEKWSPSYTTTTVGYSNSLTDRIKVGVAVNVVSEKIIRTSATGFAFDAGIQYSNLANINGLSFGVVLKNLGPSMKYGGPDLLRKANDASSKRGPQWYAIDTAPFELPSLFQIGVGYSYSLDDMNSFNFGGIFENNNYAYDSYRGSVEYSFSDMLFVRGSYTMTDGLDAAYNLWGTSFGAGINYDLGYFKIKVDYAYRDSQYFGGLNQFGVTFGL